MAEESTPSYETHGGDNREGRDSPGRGGRQTGPKEPGGLRIRLSDNEMKAARALQEAFGLRSPVAVLGFALRTLAQQLEAGQLDALVVQQRGEGDGRSRPSGEEGGGERRERRDRVERGGQLRQVRVDPFARPSRPAAPVPTPLEDESEADEIEAASGADAALVGSDGLDLEVMAPESTESAAPEQTEAEA